MKLRPYQEQLVSAVVADVIAGVPEVVLAGCPGSGKTLMSIAAIGRLLASGAVKRVLVLAHGTKLLRSQYAETLAANAPPFTWATFVNQSAKGHVPLSEIEAQVVVSLPQGIVHGDIPEFDLIVVDEAHQFYGAQMMGDIIAKAKAPRALLLTGTPSPFVAKGVPIHAVSMQEAYEAGRADPNGPWISDAAIKLLQSHYDVRYSEYNDGGEIKGSVGFGRSETDRTLDDIGAWISGNVAEVWPARFRRIGKTMLVCRSQEIALHAADMFTDAGVSLVLSTSDTDDGGGVERFKADASIALLIVVRRANLGFDFPGLSTVIDMTGSINIDRIFQMFARTVRPAPAVRKMFIKIASAELFEYTQSILRASLLLAGRSLYLTWNGINLGGILVPVTPKTTENDTRAPARPSVSPVLAEIDEGFLMFGDFFRVETGADGKLIGGATLGSVAIALGFKATEINPEGKKQALLEFYRLNGKPVKNDHPLWGAQVDRTWKSSERFDQEVYDAATAVGLRENGRYERYVGQKFSSLTVMEVSLRERGKLKIAFATVKCDCGTSKAVNLHNLKRGNTRSCGCRRVEATKAVNASLTFEKRSQGASKAQVTRANARAEIAAWTRPDAEGRQTCTVCEGEGIDRREGGSNCCLNCDGEGYRWLERGKHGWELRVNAAEATA